MIRRECSAEHGVDACGAGDGHTCNQEPSHRVFIPHNGQGVSLLHLFLCQSFVFAHIQEGALSEQIQKNRTV
jgi:hypothetical protein